MRGRMKYLDKWERQLGNRYVLEDGERMLERNEGRRLDLECRYEGCGQRWEVIPRVMFQVPEKWSYGERLSRKFWSCCWAGVLFFWDSLFHLWEYGAYEL